MKIAIDEAGDLSVAGHEKRCPFAPPYGPAASLHPCGDWCPHFGEPVHNKFIGEMSGVEIDVGWTLTLCHDTILYGEIEDRRKP